MNVFKSRLMLYHNHLKSYSQEALGGKQLEVLQKKIYTGRMFVLNRPKALNSLNLDMIRLIHPQLQAWEQSDQSKLIILKSIIDKAFCAGGDVKNLMMDVKKGMVQEGIEFFKEEYVLDHYIASLKTPFVSLINGITMGGGVGISIHSPFRVATEKTIFSMPETTIGLFPDVGSSFFLSRMDGCIGKYLAMTSYRLKGVDTYFCGVSTHYVLSEKLSELEDRLCDLDSSDYEIVNSAIDDFSCDISKQKFSLSPFIKAINRCFKFNSVKDIINALKQETDQKEWAEKTLESLRKLSPSSLVITSKMLDLCKNLTIKQCFELDYHLVKKRIVSHDLYEGVDALLIRKTKDPKWIPDSIEKLDETEIQKEYFDTFNPSKFELPFSGSATYSRYPHDFGIINAHEIRDHIKSNSKQSSLSADDIVRHFILTKGGKAGTEYKIKNVISNFCKTTEDGKIQWIE